MNADYEKQRKAARLAALLEVFGAAWLSRHADCSTDTNSLVYQGGCDLLEEGQEILVALYNEQPPQPPSSPKAA